jgi:Inner membrane component of T3SS, cytoplasmic domain
MPESVTPDRAADPSSHGEPLIEHDPTIVYQPVGDAAAEESGSRLAGKFHYGLVVERGPSAGLAYVLGEGETTAGRSGEADIFLGDVTVSRDHVRFHVDDTGLWMEDLGSTNGTYVNGARHDKARLEAGDEVIVGKFHLVVIVGDA